MGKATATVLKGLQSAAEAAFPLFRGVMRSLRLREAFDLMGGLVRVTLRGVSEFPSSFDEIAQFVGDLLTGTRRLWDNFIHFVQRAGADLLVRMGFEEGSALVGGIIRRGTSLSDEAVRTVDSVGDDLARLGADLSDEASEGLGIVSNRLEEPAIRRFFDGFGCVLHVTSGVSSSGRLLKIRWDGSRSREPLLQSGGCDAAGEALEIVARAGLSDLTDESFEGLQALVRHGGAEFAEEAIGNLRNLGYADDVIHRSLGVIRLQESAWSQQAIEGIAKLVGRDLDDIALQVASKYADDVAQRSFSILGESTQVWDSKFVERLPLVLDRHGIGSTVANQIDGLKNVDGIDKLVFDVGAPAGSKKEIGALFQLEYADHLPNDRISRLSDIISSDDAADILLDKGSIVVDTKFRNWPNYNPFVLDGELTQLLKQVDDLRLRYPGKPIEVVFDSRPGPVPDIIRSGLEGAGVIVKTFP